MNTAFCFDLDGTLTRDEILPMIAREVGIYEEIMALTEATLRGILPFDKSFRLRVRLLQDVDAGAVSDKVRKVWLYKKVIGFIQANSSRCFIVTGNLDVWTSGLIQEIGCSSFTSTARMRDSRLVGIEHVLDKGDAVCSLRKRFDRIVAVGDGMNDVPMFENSDIRIANASTHLPVDGVLELADYVTFSEDGLCNLLSTLS